MTNSISLGLFSLLRLCECHVEVVSLYEHHALNLPTGDLLPITYTLPPMYDEEEEPQADTNKRKRTGSPSNSEQN